MKTFMGAIKFNQDTDVDLLALIDLRERRQCNRFSRCIYLCIMYLSHVYNILLLLSTQLMVHAASSSLSLLRIKL